MKKKTTDRLSDGTRSLFPQPHPQVRRLWPYVLAGVCIVAVGVLATAAGRTPVWRALSYNVQNLFDDEVAGGEFPSFTPQSGYDGYAYWSRLDVISTVLRELEVRQAQLLVLIEVEHPGVVAELTGTLIGGEWHIAAGLPPQFGTQVVVASRVPSIQTHIHAATEVIAGGDRNPLLWRSRDAVAVRLPRGPAGKEPFLVYAAHWKSQRGGAEQTAAYRILEARLARSVIRRAEIPALLIGDLNEDPLLEADGSRFSALEVDGAGGSQLPASVSSVSVDNQMSGILSLPVTARPWPRERFIWLWADDSGPGSYVYRGLWQRLDQAFLYLPAAAGDTDHWFAGLQAQTRPRLTDEHGVPLRYDPRTGRGVSDHLPISVTLARRPIR